MRRWASAGPSPLNPWSGSAKSPCRGFATRILDPGSANADPGLFFCARNAALGRRVAGSGINGCKARTTLLGRHVYRVHPEAGTWIVAKEGEAEARSEFGSRETAIAEACRLAEADQPSRVTVDD